MTRSIQKAALAASLLLVGILAPLRARGDDAPVPLSVDDAAAKRGKGSPVLVVFTKDGSDHDKAALAALADKKLAKSWKDGAVLVRVDPGDTDSAQKLGLTAEKTECTVALDGYGVSAGKHDKAPSTDAFAKLLKAAQEATAKKKKIEKAIETAVTRAEAAIKKDDPATACQQLAPTLEYEKTVPCESMTKARKLADDLTEKANAILEKARAASGAGNYAEAHKHVADVNAKYPLPSIEEEAKKVKKEIAEAEAESSR